MATQGPNSPSTVSSDTGGFVSGSYQTWTSPQNAAASDASYATASGSAMQNFGSYWLHGSGFGFTIPTSATINGFLVEVQGKTSTGNSRGFQVQLYKAGALVGSGQSGSALFSTTEQYLFAGGSTNLFGTTWTPADVNASNFGAGFFASTQTNGMTLSINHIRVTVYYTGGATTFTQTCTASTVSGASVPRVISTAKSASAATSAALLRASSYFRTLLGTASPLAAVVPSQVITVALSAITAGSALLTRSVGKIYAASAGTAASYSSVKRFLQPLFTSVGTSASYLRGIATTLRPSAGTSASIERSQAKSLLASADTTASKTVALAVTRSASALTNGVLDALRLAESFTLSLNASVSASASISKARSLVLLATSSVGAVFSYLSSILTRNPGYAVLSESSESAGLTEASVNKAGAWTEQVYTAEVDDTLT